MDDIYADLDNFDMGETINELKEKNTELTNKVSELVQKLETTIKDLEEVKKENMILTQNISKLYNTAKADYDRRTKIITDLRKQVDDLLFRRNKVGQQQNVQNQQSNFKIPKRKAPPEPNEENNAIEPKRKKRKVNKNKSISRNQETTAKSDKLKENFYTKNIESIIHKKPNKDQKDRPEEPKNENRHHDNKYEDRRDKSDNRRRRSRSRSRERKSDRQRSECDRERTRPRRHSSELKKYENSLVDKPKRYSEMNKKDKSGSENDAQCIKAKSSSNSPPRKKQEDKSDTKKDEESKLDHEIKLHNEKDKQHIEHKKESLEKPSMKILHDDCSNNSFTHNKLGNEQTKIVKDSKNKETSKIDEEIKIQKEKENDNIAPEIESLEKNTKALHQKLEETFSEKNKPPPTNLEINKTDSELELEEGEISSDDNEPIHIQNDEPYINKHDEKRPPSPISRKSNTNSRGTRSPPKRKEDRFRRSYRTETNSRRSPRRRNEDRTKHRSQETSKQPIEAEIRFKKVEAIDKSRLSNDRNRKKEGENSSKSTNADIEREQKDIKPERKPSEKKEHISEKIKLKENYRSSTINENLEDIEVDSKQDKKTSKLKEESSDKLMKKDHHKSLRNASANVESNLETSDRKEASLEKPEKKESSKSSNVLNDNNENSPTDINLEKETSKKNEQMLGSMQLQEKPNLSRDFLESNENLNKQAKKTSKERRRDKKPSERTTNDHGQIDNHYETYCSKTEIHLLEKLGNKDEHKTDKTTDSEHENETFKKNDWLLKNMIGTEPSEVKVLSDNSETKSQCDKGEMSVPRCEPTELSVENILNSLDKIQTSQNVEGFSTSETIIVSSTTIVSDRLESFRKHPCIKQEQTCRQPTLKTEKMNSLFEAEPVSFINKSEVLSSSSSSSFNSGVIGNPCMLSNASTFSKKESEVSIEKENIGQNITQMVTPMVKPKPKRPRCRLLP